MKRLKLVFITFVIVVILLVVEIVIIRSASEYDLQSSVIYAAVKIPEGTEITAEMLEERRISQSMAHELSIQGLEEAVGKEAGENLEEGEMILSTKLNLINRIDNIELEDDNNRLFSVEFRADQANGWWLKVGQYVDIIFVPNKTDMLVPDLQENLGANIVLDGENTEQGIFLSNVLRLRDVRIAALIDENGELIDEFPGTVPPKYISFEVDQQEDLLLAYAKSNGRLEISVIPEKSK